MKGAPDELECIYSKLFPDIHVLISEEITESFSLCDLFHSSDRQMRLVLFVIRTDTVLHQDSLYFLLDFRQEGMGPESKPDHPRLML